MSRFFIHHPIFAWVIALVIMLAGAISMVSLPVSQYPDVASPAIRVSATYPGASAQTVQDTVTQVIEQNMTGLDNLLYMSSTSDSSGQASITLTFAMGTDPDTAQVQVQNKLQLATPMLPQTVQQQGVSVTKSNSSMFLALAFISTDGSMDQTDLSDYVNATIKDELSRVDGVGDVTTFGGQYAMRIWLDPDKLHKYNLTPSDVVGAIKAQNVQVAAGQLGGLPVPDDGAGAPPINVTIKAQELLQTPADFENILLRVEPSGGSVFVKDVARVEIGSESYYATSRLNGAPAGGLALSLASGANALSTAERVKQRIEELKPYMPEGVEAVVAMDTTPPVRMSIEEVAKTLFEAVALVFLVMLLFLQNVRATLIPTIAVPVVLLGTFGVLAVFGYSINTLTLFGMVLAIGLLVDDAIVVVENVERVMSEEHLDPVAATEKSMGQITSSLVGIAVVLSAVFLPMAFMSGSTGVIYRQFSVTIVSAMLLSVLIALVLTPALCASMLKSRGGHAEAQHGFAGWFNRAFNAGTVRYHRGIRSLARRGGRLMLVYAALVACLAFLYMRLPTAYLPSEDQGVLFALVQMPSNTPQERTLEVLKQLEDYGLTQEKDTVERIMSVAGFSFSGSGQNTGMAFISLKDWEERPNPDQSAAAVAARFRQAFTGMVDAQVVVFQPPAIIELGTSAGFTMELLDRGGVGHEKLMEARNQLLGNAAANPAIAYARPNGLDDTAQYAISIDNRLAASLGLSLSDISTDLSVLAGGAYVNDFIDRGRVKKVYVQADAPFRMVEADLRHWNFRNNLGDLVPFSSIASTDWTMGPARLERYNGVASLEIQGEPVPGVSSGTAMAAMEAEVAKLGKDFGVDWTGLSYQERLAGSQTLLLYGLAAVVVFLALAALYESWSIPIAVILVIPLGMLGAVLGTSLRGLSNDVYFQVGMLATMGLGAKNAILVVECARTLWRNGAGLREAAAEAARLRLRPILMTSLAFGLGVLPLMIASGGASSASQKAVGTAVFCGTVAATALGIFFIPVFFVVVCSVADRLFGKKRKGAVTVDPTPVEG